MANIGDQIVVAVGQKPFDVNYNRFCTLVPLFDEQGRLVDTAEFPNDGLVWWLVLQEYHHLAEPGKLLTVSIEHANGYDPNDPRNQRYQASLSSVAALSEWCDVVNATGLVRGPNDLVNNRTPGILDHPPTKEVYARVGSMLYGPFEPTEPRRDASTSEVRFGLRPTDKTNRVNCIDVDKLNALGTRDWVRALKVPHSRNNKARNHDGAECAEFSYALIRKAKIEDLRRQGDVEQRVLRSDRDIINAAAKAVLSRRKRQELMRAIDEAMDELRAEGSVQDAVVLLQALRADAEMLDHELQGLANAFLEGGLFTDQLRHALEQRAAQHVERKAGELSTQINEKIAERQERLAQLKSELAQLERHKASELEEARQALAKEHAERARLLDERETHVATPSWSWSVSAVARPS